MIAVFVRRTALSAADGPKTAIMKHALALIAKRVPTRTDSNMDLAYANAI
jgi:hypothetical protein